MADFMTVLSASQKQALGGKQANLLTSLLPEGLFGSVLSAQLDLPQNAAATLALPAALTEGVAIQLNPAAKKAAQIAVIDLNSTAAQVPAVAVPVVVGKDVEPQVDKPLAAAFVQSLDEPADASLDKSQDGSAEKRGGNAVEVRTAAAGGHHSAISAANSAGPGSAPGQDLPGAGRVLVTAGSDTVAMQALTAGTTVASPQLAAANDMLVDALPVTDVSSVHASRHLGQFEQVVRAPESRVQVALEAPVRSQAFPAELSEKIVWLAGRQSQWADLSLNPPQLGAIEVRLSLSGGEAGAQFFSPHPAVREAIESALPKLREMLAQAGITLGDAQVREEAFAQRESNGSNSSGGNATSGESTVPVASTIMGVRAGQGLVDLYV